MSPQTGKDLARDVSAVRAVGRSLVLAGLLTAGAAHAQPRLAGAGAVPAATAAALEELAAHAQVIFAGRVVSVQRNDAAGYVDIAFRVEEAVRGCAGGSTYVLREWSGLWTGQAERYLAGERLLMLLAARGKSGMSAPVGGMAGRIPLLGARTPPLIHGKTPAPADSAAEDGLEQVVDLRWVQALAPRANRAAASVGRAEWRGPVAPLPPAPQPSAPAAGPSLSAVLSLLGGASAR